MKTYFNEKGHLTDEAFYDLIYGEPDAADRLLMADHLSYCNECIDRYMDFMTDDTLLTPMSSVEVSVMGKIQKDFRRQMFRKYATAMVAGFLAMLLWTGGIFNIGLQKVEAVHGNTKPPVMWDFGKELNYKLDSFFYDINHWKGVFNDGK